MIKTTYETDCFIKFAEIDLYNEGCQPDTGYQTGGDITLLGATVDELIENILNFTGADDYELNACDVDGRIDIQVMENPHGTPATMSELDGWKREEYTLYLANYSFYIKKVTRKTVKLKTKLQKSA